MISRFLLMCLTWIYSFTRNYGWAIIVLTILIKLVLYPLQHKSIVSMKKMQKLQPKVNALKDRYKKAKSDADQRQKMNAEMMKLYQQEGVNPMSGCLPIVLQLPILWGFYSLLSHAIELRGAGVHSLDYRSLREGSLLHHADSDDHHHVHPAGHDTDYGRSCPEAYIHGHAADLRLDLQRVSERARALLARPEHFDNRSADDYESLLERTSDPGGQRSKRGQMSSQRFEGGNLDEALGDAARTLGVEKYQLRYHVVLEKRGFLGAVKRVVIEAEPDHGAPEPPEEPRTRSSPERASSGRGRPSHPQNRRHEPQQRRSESHRQALTEATYVDEPLPEQGDENPEAKRCTEWVEKLLELAD